ncbi:MAG: hypothetical protein FJW35_14045, partial [Acidobacteria bacterium]|nr:hypothetical protein [Acidobacteriota bacterium]
MASPFIDRMSKSRTSVRLRKILWVAILAPALSAAVENGAAQSAEPGKQATTRPNQSRPPEPEPFLADPSLSGIGLFRIVRRDLEAAFSRRGSKPIVEIVNAFSVRNRGRFYGSAYEYHRNDFFDARNFFDPVGEKLPEYKRNQFGGSLG